MREREVGGGAAEGGRLTPAPSVPDGLLRPLLQLALDVARVGEAAVPTVDAPRPLRPFLRFARLPDRALAAVRRSLDEDESFRARVAEVATEELVGRAGVLYLSRPQGWDAELAALAAAATNAAEADREEREDRTARRRVTHAEEATQRAEEAAARARAEAARAATELSHERRERRVAQEERDRLVRRASTLEAEREAARRRAAEAAGEVERLRAEVARLTEQLAEARQPPPPLAPPPLAEPPTAEPPAAEPPAAEVAAGPDLAVVAHTVATAAQAAAALGAALAEAAAALAPPPPAPAPAAVPAPVAAAPRPAPPRRRRPLPLPPAVLDDTAEAAEHLVRVPGALVLVDGYNAAKLLWPAAPAAELRERLVDALSELEARCGADVQVVFDGADVPAAPPRPGGRRPVRVTFSPPDVEADDVILALVDAVPPARPVVVASSDRRVQDGARRRGANVISSAQLSAVLRRS